ncbi:hypothetical protein AAE478_008177 [Parahypoxylon ruwenzoriense]
MNRFRTKRKAKEETSAPRPSQDSDSSLPFRPFRKGKKAQEPERVEIDLSTALPSNDEFRTSLLMTGLSARFSMLREQDDPSTKIGKASDDSVLFPKRQSRLDYGVFRGLGDIAEVESIKVAPFARKNSYQSEDADSVTSSSVIGRSKPIEGNNLFGGRQKIYKIPVGASSSKTGMGGRALYEDDVALSAFQKWRQAEKERKSSEDEPDDTEKRSFGDMEVDAPRAESPVLSSYNQKRETSSTMSSSIPSLARNSTAATSVTSQRAPSMKDWQPSTSSTAAPERSVTRTRRLYETGLNNDIQEQQSSALSRIDTLARQRTFGTRTPDLVQNSPSPTTMGFVERFGSERKILAKSSAPNLRSMSPPTTASSVGTPDLGVRIPSAAGMRSDFGGAPPLSPPISETEENSILPIHPNDRGKATALGVFQKPSQPYDETRYAQRQLQRQQGRETPTQRSRDELNTSRSSSPSQRKESVSRIEIMPSAPAPSPREDMSTSFLADPNDSDCSPAVSPKPLVSPQVLLRRPSDSEHPALRNLSTAKSRDKPLSIAENAPSPSSGSKGLSPADSPTLGPVTGAGLSGMVRQHLRGDSNGSSIYGGLPQTSGLESRFPAGTEVTPAFDLGSVMNPWELPDCGRDWALDLDVTEPLADTQSRSSNVPDSEDFRTSMGTIPIGRDDGDEFATQLADGARRVRERLTTYVESDSRSASPRRLSDAVESRDQAPPPRQNGLGLLRPKSSRGSLADRSRDQSQSKAMKMLGLGASNNPQSGSPVRGPTREENEEETTPFGNNELEDKANGTEEPHAGLRAFRQARRELQKVKEFETQVRHQQQPSGPISDTYSTRSTPTRERPSGHKSPEQERKPPPVFYQQRSPSEESGRSPRNFGSREYLKTDRDRSGSDSSNDGRSSSRQARPTNNGRRNLQTSQNGRGARHPMRSPGLPGTDIKRSPIMPPYPYPGSAQSNRPNFGPNGNLHVQTSRGYESSQLSPVSPMPSPYGVHGPSTPITLPSSPRPVPSPSHTQDNTPPNMNDVTRRKIKPKDISDPTPVMSTSRVPTLALPPDAARNRSRSNSRSAPPLPPINPRRRQDVSTTRAIFENGNAGRGEVEAALDRRRLRPVNSPGVSVGPPTSRMVNTQGAKHPGMGLPGGMI